MKNVDMYRDVLLARASRQQGSSQVIKWQNVLQQRFAQKKKLRIANGTEEMVIKGKKDAL